MKKLSLFIFLILLFLGCKNSDKVDISYVPVQEICSVDACGTFVATGPNSGLTASHVARRGTIAVHAGGGVITFTDPADLQPAQIYLPNVIFKEYYDTEQWVTGTATYETLHGTFPIYIYTDRIFGGQEPIHGDSGSPIIQDGKVIGVVTHSVVGGGLYAKVKQ